MTRRPATTLIEVLVAMFIMAIGMLALMVLFPLGALNMGQALKDDRCASTAAMAENVAIAMNVRHDGNVATVLTSTTPVYVDPYGAQQVPAIGPLGGFIPRISPSFAGTPQLADRWFSLPDDVTFSESGTPDVSSGVVQRGRRYSYAYLLKQQESLPTQALIQLFVVVYSGRPTGVLTLEPTYAAAGTAATNGLTLLWAVGQTTPGIKRGGWILDNNGSFYRVTNIVDTTANSMVVEVRRT